MGKRIILMRLRKFFIRFTTYILFCLIAFLLIFTRRIYPYASALAASKASGELNKRATAAVYEALSDNDIEYSSFITMNSTEEGKAQSLQINSIKLHSVRAEAVEAIYKVIEENEKLSVAIPLGALLGGEIGAAYGPDINLSLMSANLISCDFETKFCESGINQTLHSISLDIKLEAAVMIGAKKTAFPVSFSLPIAETVIIGEVPDAYTHINRYFDDVSESEIDDIYDFGASAE